MRKASKWREGGTGEIGSRAMKFGGLGVRLALAGMCVCWRAGAAGGGAAEYGGGDGAAGIFRLKRDGGGARHDGTARLAGFRKSVSPGRERRHCGPLSADAGIRPDREYRTRWPSPA